MLIIVWVQFLVVNIEYKAVDDKAKYKGKEDLIIDQSVKKDATLVKGDTIILYLPKIEKDYPDFVKEGYSVSEVESFCKEYDITLEKEEVEDDTKDAGTIIYQSRPAGSTIAERVTLKIKVTKKSKEAEAGDDHTNTDDGMVPYEEEDN